MKLDLRRVLVAGGMAVFGAALGLAAAACTSGERGGEAPAATSTTRQLGEDPNVAPTTDPDAASTREELIRALEADGFPVTRLKPAQIEGGRLFGMTHSWEGRVAGVESFINLFATVDEVHGWLETGERLGAVVVFDNDDIWAVSLDSDSSDRAKSVKLAREIGRGLSDWAEGIRVIA